MHYSAFLFSCGAGIIILSGACFVKSCGAGTASFMVHTLLSCGAVMISFFIEMLYNLFMVQAVLNIIVHT